MNTKNLDIGALKGKVLMVESNIPLLTHRGDGSTRVFRVVPDLDSLRLFCGGKGKALIAFPTNRFLDVLVSGDEILQAGTKVKVIQTSEKSIIIDIVEEADAR